MLPNSENCLKRVRPLLALRWSGPWFGIESPGSNVRLVLNKVQVWARTKPFKKLFKACGLRNLRLKYKIFPKLGLSVDLTLKV